MKVRKMCQFFWLLLELWQSSLEMTWKFQRKIRTLYGPEKISVLFFTQLKGYFLDNPPRIQFYF